MSSRNQKRRERSQARSEKYQRRLREQLEMIMTPQARHRTETCHQAQVSEAKEQKEIQYLLLGDSLFANIPPGMKSELCRLGCFCAGIPGDSIQNVLYRLGDTLQLLSAMPDELRGVVLLIGTNNIERFSAEAVCDGIVAIVESIHAARPTLGVCVFGLLPRGAWRDSPISDAKLSQRILSCNAQVEAAAKAKDLDFIFFDLSEVFAPGGVRVNNFFRRDQLHLTEHGYQALSAQLLKALNALQA